MSARGFPGSREEWYLAGTIATTDVSVSPAGSLPGRAGTANHTTVHTTARTMLAHRQAPILSCRAMRTGSHQVTGTILAAGFLGGWVSASWIAPAPVTTQVAPPRPAPVAPVVVMPHVALSQVQAPDTTPVAERNPFTFRDRTAAPAHAGATSRTASPLELPVATDSVDAPVDAPLRPVWRLVGLATAADGGTTAILTSATGLQLVTVGATLPDGAVVAAIDGTRVTIRRASGETETLDLP